MAALTLTALAIAGTALAAVGTAVSVVGQARQAQALGQAEAQRKQLADLEAQRARIKIQRDAALARGQAVATAGSQGGLQGSGLSGGLAQILGNANTQTNAVNQNASITDNIFEANARAGAAGTLASAGQGLSSFGGELMTSLPTFERIGWAK